MVNYKSYFVAVTLLFGCHIINAQTTDYYRLTKTVINGVTSSSVSGGQFLSFNGKMCYESDKEGIQVNGSRLEYKYDDNGVRVYSGNSYWGQNTTFFFTTDKSKLSVRTPSGDKYVYERCAAPSGATTCSLIRKEQSNDVYIAQPVYPVGGGYGGGYSGGSTTGGTTTGGSVPQQPQRRIKCSSCTNGRRVYESMYGGFSGGLGKDMRRCSECGKTYDAKSINHYHSSCNNCHGTGYID